MLKRRQSDWTTIRSDKQLRCKCHQIFSCYLQYRGISNKRVGNLVFQSRLVRMHACASLTLAHSVSNHLRDKADYRRKLDIDVSEFCLRSYLQSMRTDAATGGQPLCWRGAHYPALHFLRDDLFIRLLKVRWEEPITCGLVLVVECCRWNCGVDGFQIISLSIHTT